MSVLHGMRASMATDKQQLSCARWHVCIHQCSAVLESPHMQRAGQQSATHRSHTHCP